MLRVILELTPEPADVHGNRVLVHIVSLAVPDRIQDLLLGKDTPRMLYKIEQKLVFGDRKSVV